MASNVDMIQGAFQSAPGLVQGVTDYNDKYGDATPEEIHSSEILRRIAMGEDPVTVARDVHAKYTSQGLGAPGATPQVPQAQSPQIGTRVATPQATSQEGLGASLASSNAAVGMSPAMEQVAASTPMGQGTQLRNSGAMSQPVVSQQSDKSIAVATPASSDAVPQEGPWKPKRPELARVNATYAKAGELLDKRKGDQAALERLKAQLREEADYLKSTYAQSLADKEHEFKTKLEGHKADAAMNRLKTQLSSEEGRAMLSAEMRLYGIDVKDSEFKDTLNFWRESLGSKERFQHAMVSLKGDPRIKVLTTLIQGFTGNPAFASQYPEIGKVVEDAKDLMTEEEIKAIMGGGSSQTSESTSSQTTPPLQAPAPLAPRPQAPIKQGLTSMPQKGATSQAPKVAPPPAQEETKVVAGKKYKKTAQGWVLTK